MDIYTALGSPILFAIGNDEAEPKCLLAKAANKATTKALEAARRQFENTLKRTSVADLASDWRSEMTNCVSMEDQRK